jgi:hypothetical protein
MAGDIIPVIFEGAASGSATLPVNFGTLGGDVLHVQQILDDSGNVAIADATSRFSNATVGNQLNVGDDSSDALFLALIRAPGTQAIQSF